MVKIYNGSLMKKSLTEYMNFRDGKLESEYGILTHGNSLEKLEDTIYHREIDEKRL